MYNPGGSRSSFSYCKILLGTNSISVTAPVVSYIRHSPRYPFV